MKRSKPLQRKSRLRPVSPKRRKENVEYARLREKFLEENSFCRRCGSQTNIQVHHSAGRNKFLLRTDTWIALCFGCHRMTHDNPSWAVEKGFILTPEQRRKLA